MDFSDKLDLRNNSAIFICKTTQIFKNANYINSKVKELSRHK